MTDISLPITSIVALLNGGILLALTINVIVLRRRDGVVLGDNDDRVLTKAIRGQANAAEQIPLALLIFALAELQGANAVILMALACVFTLGRAMHALYFAWHGLTWRFRFYGMFLTLLAQFCLLLVLFGVMIN